MAEEQQGSWTPEAAATEEGVDSTGRRLLFVAWRDLANRRAGGSEVLVDRLAAGMKARGDRVSLLCGGPSTERDYEVIRSGGTYSQFIRAPAAYWRHLRDSDLVVEVCNGMPFLTPIWCSRPKICLVNHMHTELWRMMFPRPVAALGQFAESKVMPWAHRDNLFLTVSNSTADALRDIGVGDDRIRQICNGVVQPDPLTPRSPEPLFMALGRLTEYKRIDMLLRLWERVRNVVGGKLVIVGDGPERSRLEALAGPGVIFTGRVSEEEKHRLLCSAWLLLHPALIEGWGIVITEAAIRGTPAIGFNVPGLRDSVVNGAYRSSRQERGPVRICVGIAGTRPAPHRGHGSRGQGPGRAIALVGGGGRVRPGGRRGARPGWSAAQGGRCGRDYAGMTANRTATNGTEYRRWRAARVLRGSSRPGQLGAGPGPQAGADAHRRSAGGARSGRDRRHRLRRRLGYAGGRATQPWSSVRRGRLVGRRLAAGAGPRTCPDQGRSRGIRSAAGLCLGRCGDHE